MSRCKLYITPCRIYSIGEDFLHTFFAVGAKQRDPSGTKDDFM